MIIYTYLGKNSDCINIIAEETQESLRIQEKEYNNGNIFVTTTSNLLKYYVTRKYLKWKKVVKSDTTCIKILGIHDPLIYKDIKPDDRLLQRVTFYVDDPLKVRVFLGEEEIKNIKINSADHTGCNSIMFALRHPTVNFPKLLN